MGTKRLVTYFMIAKTHYLAIANCRSAKGTLLNSTIYQWHGQYFVMFQNITTSAAKNFAFFQIFPDIFLAVANHGNGDSFTANSTIYIWKDGQFEKFQDIKTEGAHAISAVFTSTNKTMLAVANRGKRSKYGAFSFVMEWSGKAFLPLVNLQTYRGNDVTSFNINNETFVVFANGRNSTTPSIDSLIYKWNGTRFVLFQKIRTHEAKVWHAFMMCGESFLSVANFKDGHKSVICKHTKSGFHLYRAFNL